MPFLDNVRSNKGNMPNLLSFGHHSQKTEHLGILFSELRHTSKSRRSYGMEGGIVSISRFSWGKEEFFPRKNGFEKQIKSCQSMPNFWIIKQKEINIGKHPRRSRFFVIYFLSAYNLFVDTRKILKNTSIFSVLSK